jgi:deferrochelatase/peroxidase EfeB
VSRRALLGGTTTAALGALVADVSSSGTATRSRAVPFRGTHQSGIATPAQACVVFCAFDVTASRAALAALLRAWTDGAERMTLGEPIAPPTPSDEPATDTGEVEGLGPAGLTITFGMGPSLFDDRFGLRARRPRALQDLPAFVGDELDPARSGGDLCVQACADDLQVAFHAVRNLARLGLGTVELRWLQVGFSRTSSTSAAQSTPRNLLGFKDGTANLKSDETTALDDFVWIGDESDQAWLRGGSILVARRIRLHLEAWAAIPLSAQQSAIGRRRTSGAPLTGRDELDPVDLHAHGPRGVPVIALDAHIRLAAPETNGGVRLLRRGYSFADGLDPRTGELDAGLFFVCFQKDPLEQFARIQRTLSERDALRTYLVHTSSAVFACPPGASAGGYVGEALFE